VREASTSSWLCSAAGYCITWPPGPVVCAQVSFRCQSLLACSVRCFVPFVILDVQGSAEDPHTLKAIHSRLTDGRHDRTYDNAHSGSEWQAATGQDEVGKRPTRELETGMKVQD